MFLYKNCQSSAKSLHSVSISDTLTFYRGISGLRLNTKYQMDVYNTKQNDYCIRCNHFHL